MSEAVFSQQPVGSEGLGAFSSQGGNSTLEPRFNETFSAGNVIRPGSKEGGDTRSNAKRRAMQKSIDLQDYLNYSTGLDYRKVAAQRQEPPSRRHVQTS